MKVKTIGIFIHLLLCIANSAIAQQFNVRLTGEFWETGFGAKEYYKTYSIFGCVRDLNSSIESEFYPRFQLTTIDKTGNLLTQKQYYIEEKTFFRNHIKSLNINEQHGLVVHYKGIENGEATLTGNIPALWYLNNEGTDTLRSVKLNLMPLGGMRISDVIYDSVNSRIIGVIEKNNVYGSEFYITTTDTLGNLLWLKEYPAFEGRQIYGIAVSDKNNILLVGTLDDSIRYVWDKIGVKFTGHKDRIWYCLLDSAGNIKWIKSLTGPYYEPPYVDELEYLNFSNGPATEGSILQGVLPVVDGFVLYGLTNFYPYMAKINNDGDILWQYKYDGQIADSLYRAMRKRLAINKMIEHKGYLYSIGVTTKGDNGASIAKYTQGGRRIWYREYSFQSGSANELDYIISTQNGFLLLGGSYDLYDPFSSKDIWAVSTNEFGCLEEGCELNDIIDTLTNVPDTAPSINYKFTVTPNPASTSFKVQSSFQGNFNLIITDILGKERLSSKMESNEYLFLNELEIGLFFVSIYSLNGELLQTTKLVVEH